METFATLGIKVSTEGAVQSKEQLEQYAQTVAKVEAVQSAFANSTLVLSQKTRTALAAEAVEYEKQKQSRIAGFTEQLRQVAEMKRVMDQANSEHMTRLNQIKQAESENLRQRIASEKAHMEEHKRIMNQIKQNESENFRQLATLRKQDSDLRKQASDKAINDYDKFLAKVRETNAKINATTNVSGLNQQVQPQPLFEYTRAVNGATTAQSAFIQAMNRGAQQSASSIRMIGGMSDSYRQFVQAQNQVTQAQNQVITTGNATHSMFDRITTKVIAITAAMLAYRTLSALLSVPGGIIETNKQMELLRIRLEALTGSVERAKVAFKDLVALDFRTPFDIEGLTQAFLTLKNYGLNPTQRVMEALTETIAKFGGTTQNMTGFAIQLGQAWSKGRLQMQDMRVMIENGVPVISLLEKTTGKSAAAILEMSKNGEITREVMQKLLDIMSEENFGSSARVVDSMAGATNNLKTAWIQLQDAFMGPETESRFKKMTEWFTSLLRSYTAYITATRDIGNELYKNKGEQDQLRETKSLYAPEMYEKAMNKLQMDRLQILMDEQKILKENEKARAENNKESETGNDLAQINKAEEEANQKALKDSRDIQKDILAIQEKQIQAANEYRNAVLDAGKESLDMIQEMNNTDYESAKNYIEQLYKEEKTVASEYYDELKKLRTEQYNEERQNIIDKYELESQKMTENFGKQKSLIEAIIAWENRGRMNEDRAGVISSTGAMGWAQVLPSTALDPGYGVAPMKEAIEAGEEFFKGSIEKIRAWAIKYQKELVEFAERYIAGLVKHFGSVEKALQVYGDHTPGYIKGVLALMGQMDGASKKNVASTLNEGRVKADLYKLEQRFKQDLIDLTNKQTEEESKYNTQLIAEKDKLIAQYMQLILSAKEYYEWTLKQAGIKPQDIPGLSKQNDLNTIIKQGNDAAEAIKKYSESVNTASDSTMGLNESVGILFDGMNEGLSNIVGAFTQMSKGFSDINHQMDKVYADRKTLSDEALKVEKAHFAKLLDLQNSNFDNKNKLIDEENNKYNDFLKDKENAFNKNDEKIKLLQEEMVQTSISGFRRMAGAAANMFEENSKGRKALHNVEMVLSAIEMAMEIKKLAVDAAAAVLNQGKGDPYSAFARIAAMAAIVGAIVAGVGGYFGTSTGAKPPEGTKDTGTVLGDTTKTSNSVQNVYELLQNIHAEEYVELRGINSGVAALKGGITNVVTRLFQANTQGIVAPAGILQADKVLGLGGATKGDIGLKVVTEFLQKYDPVQKLLNKIFFGTVKEKVIGGGYQTEPFQIGGELTASQYNTIERTRKSWISKKVTYREVTSPMDEKVRDAIETMFNAMGDTMLNVATTLGKSIGQDLASRVLGYIIPALRIELYGLNAEDASKKLNGVISTVMDDMANVVFGDILKQYQQLGEGMLETAIRIVAQIAVVTEALKVSGLKLRPENIIAFTDAIVQALGGLNKFQEAWSKYFDKFYSDEEKNARIKEQLFGREITTTQKTVTKTTQGSFMGKAAVGTTFTEYVDGQLTDLFKLKTPTLTLKQKKAGLTLQDVYPDFDPYRDLKKLMEGGRKGYREVLESININTEKGAKQYAALIKLAPLADQYYTYVEQQEVKKQNIIKQGHELELQLMEAQGKTAEALAIRRKDELAAMDESLRPLQEALYAQQDANAYKLKEIEVNKQIREAEIQLMEAQGDSAGALAARRSDELAAMDEALRPLQETLYARLDEIEAVKKSIQLAKEQRSLDIDLMEKQGNAAGALAAKRADELAAMDESLRPTKQKIYDAEDRITLINDNLKELSSTFGEWAPKIKTVNELLQENKGKLDNLVNGLAQIQGTTVKTDLEKLQDLTNVKNSISSFRDNLATAIDDAISSAMSAGDKALFLQNKENQLWSQLSTAADPVAIATQLQSVTIARIQAQGQAQSEAIDKANEELQKQYDLAKEERNKQIDALNEQIDAAEKLKGFAEDLKQTIASLKFSDLSPLTYDKQLGEAKALYDRTLQGAKSGNETDMANYTSNLNAYLEEARKYYASNEGYTKIFNQLMTDATLLASKGDKLDPTIEAAKKQITQLEELNNQTLVLQSNVVDTSAEQVAALKQIDDAMAALEAQNQGAIDTQTQLILDQIAELQKIVDGQQAQMDQAKIIGDQLTAALTNPSIPVPSIPSIDGSHAEGLDYVPFNGYIAQLHVGERVLTASQARNSDGTSEELLMELRYLREEVSQLRKEQNEQTGALIQSNYDANDKAAEKVSKGSKEAAKDIAWATKTAPVIV